MNTLIDVCHIAEHADMIVDGYAFTNMKDNNVRVINLYGAHHAAIIRRTGEVLETNMDDIELSIVNDYWQRNKEIMEEATYAEIL